MAQFAGARLVEDVQTFDTLEFVFLVHVVFHYECFEVRGRHVHG